MDDAETRTFTLHREQAEFIDSLVESGLFATADDVIGAGLRALRKKDDTLEHWLRSAVVPTALAIQADPSRALSVDQVFDDIRALHHQRVATSGRDV